MIVFEFPSCCFSFSTFYIRAAAFLASHTITTLHSSIRPKDLLGEKGRSFDSLQRVYECLQRTALHDKDEVAKYHASTGLYALQEIYADQFALLSLEGDQHSSLIRKLRIV